MRYPEFYSYIVNGHKVFSSPLSFSFRRLGKWHPVGYRPYIDINVFLIAVPFKLAAFHITCKTSKHADLSK